MCPLWRKHVLTRFQTKKSYVEYSQYSNTLRIDQIRMNELFILQFRVYMSEHVSTMSTMLHFKVMQSSYQFLCIFVLHIIKILSVTISRVLSYNFIYILNLLPCLLLIDFSAYTMKLKYFDPPLCFIHAVLLIEIAIFGENPNVKRLSSIEPCKIEKLCWKVLLIFFIFCRYFGNIQLMISYLSSKIPYIILLTSK